MAPNYSPTPFAMRKRSEQYTKEQVTLITCSITAEAWAGLQDLAENFREDRHKLPVTRFINRYITMFRWLKLPDYVEKAKEQQGGVLTLADFDNGEPRIARRLRLTDAARTHLEALPPVYGIPVKFSFAGGTAIGMSLELIGRGWIVR